MDPKGFNRKLTAILSADVKGYGLLMGDDDASTANTITAYREIFTELIQSHQGRVVDAAGDNILAEFSSALNAVKSSIEIQRKLQNENAKLPDYRRMDFRIGINLGDILHKDDRIYGDGVNVAARIESLADPGGICISRGVYDQVKKKVPQGFEYLGEHAIKNITEPVRIYRILLSSSSVGKTYGKTKTKSIRIKIPSAAIIAIIVAGCSVLFWVLYPRPPEIDHSSIVSEAFFLSDKPSIAVLPFNNLSGDSEQEYFSNGITNDIITDLSKFRELSVIASNTVFSYKGKPVNIKYVRQDLGVQYVLEGSVQKIGNRLRINSQLIDANTGHHLWAERYDRELIDLFKLQSEIVQTIVSKMAVQIEETERARVMHKDTNNLKAYDYLLRGHEHTHHNTRKSNTEARLMYQRAIEIDSGYATAYAALAWTYINDFLYGWTMFPGKSLQRAHDLAKNALSFDNSNALAHSALGYIYVRRTQYDLAIDTLRRAIELNPNDSKSQNIIGSVMLYSGRKDEAIYWKEKALALNPLSDTAIYMTLAQAYYLSGRYDDAIMVLKKGIAAKPDYAGNYIVLAAVYAQVGLTADAKHAADMALQLQPFFETETFGTVFRNPEDRTKLIDGMRKAGLK